MLRDLILFLLRLALWPVQRYFERHLVLRLDFGSDPPPPPDYTPVANASKEAAEIAAQLGREQLAEARRQYDQNMAVARPIVDAQAQLMGQAYEQGNYSFRRFRDGGAQTQDALRDMAMGRMPSFVQEQGDAEARRALADVGANLDAQRASTTRSMQRMGINPNSGRMAAMQAQMDVMAAAAKAGAANNARRSAEDRAYARLGDVYNTYVGMASSAPTFYQTGTQAGNSAVNNQMAPGAGLMGGMSGAANTTLQGRDMALRGQMGILNAQANYANSLANQDSGLGGFGAVLGGVAEIARLSDRRVKENIEVVGRDERTGLTIYEFSYIDDPDMRRYQGVMADEVIAVDPYAVSYDDHGIARVNYARLGIEFKEVV